LKISVIIPTLNAALVIGSLLNDILNQTLKPDEIIVVDSESNDETVVLSQAYPLTRVIVIERTDFDHGGTRDMAFRASKGDVVLFFSQDVIIRDDCYIETLVQAALHDGVACAFGRQIARKDAPLYEKYTRAFNYPEQSNLRSANDIPRLGIKAFFFSDVCSAYRRDAYFAVGGFDFPLPTNEDMLIAAKFLHAGYQIAYCAEAVVVHSHHFNLRQEFERNYSIGFVMRKHQRLLNKGSANMEGIRYVQFVLRKLLSQVALLQCFEFCMLCVAKFFGVKLGSRAAKKNKGAFCGEVNRITRND